MQAQQARRLLEEAARAGRQSVLLLDCDPELTPLGTAAGLELVFPELFGTAASGGDEGLVLARLVTAVDAST